jgi:NitT/TauT family transport system substrate-binding protein
MTRFSWNGLCASALIALGVMAGGVSTAHAADKLIPVRLRLDWVWQAPQAIFTLAQKRGYYRDEGLDITIDRGYGGMENASAIATGNYEFLFGDMNNVMLFNAKSPDRKLVSVLVLYDAYPGSVITRKGNGITKPKDLEGKSIGAPLTTGGRVLFPAFAQANGIDENRISWQTVSDQLQHQQFARGQFDAIAGFTTTSLPNLEQLGVTRDQLTIFNYADYGVDLYGAGITVRADYVKSNPEVIRKFLRATVRGLNAMLANKTEAIETLKERDPLMDTNIELGRLNLMIDMALKRPSVEKNGVGYVDPVRLQRSIATVTNVFKLPEQPKPDEVYNGSFIPSAAERKLKF